MEESILLTFGISLLSGALSGYFASQYQSRKNHREVLYRSFIRDANFCKNYLKFLKDNDDLRSRLLKILNKDSESNLDAEEQDWYELLYKNSQINDLISDLSLFGSPSVRDKILTLEPIYKQFWVLMSRFKTLIDKKMISREEAAVFFCFLIEIDKDIRDKLLVSYTTSKGETELSKLLIDNKEFSFAAVNSLLTEVEEIMKCEIRQIF